MFQALVQQLQKTLSDGIEGAGYESSRIASKIHDYIVDYDIVRASDLFILQSHLPYKSETTESLESNQTVAGELNISATSHWIFLRSIWSILS